MENNYKKERTTENIFVAIVSIAIIVFLLIGFGLEAITRWFCTPIIWNDPEYINLTLINKEVTYSRMKLTFLIDNESTNRIKSYEFYANLDGQTLEVYQHSFANIDPYSVVEVTKEFAEGGTYKRLFKKIKDKPLEDINFSYHVKELASAEKELVENKSIVKILLLLLLSIVSGVLVLKDCVTVLWLRVVLKLIMVPGILVIGVFAFLFFSSAQSSNSSQNSDTRKEKAASAYAREAKLKAGAIARGNHREAAFAQARMDRHMADIMFDESDSAKREYQRTAQHKAGANAYGNRSEAAKSQATMDRLKSNAISKKK